MDRKTELAHPTQVGRLVLGPSFRLGSLASTPVPNRIRFKSNLQKGSYITGQIVFASRLEFSCDLYFFARKLSKWHRG